MTEEIKSEELNEQNNPMGQETDALEQEDTPKSEVELLQEQILQAKEEAAENYDKFLRATAEFENFRRRTEKERSDLLRFGAERLMKDMLPVLDSFEQALPKDGIQSDYNSEEFLKGMQLVWKQLSEVMLKNGLEPIQAKGALFDPNFHQGIQRVESSEVDQEMVGEEYAKGYQLHDRLLRPSMVSVKVPK